MASELEQKVLKKAQSWLDGHYDEETKKQVKYLIDNDMKELVESFYMPELTCVSSTTVRELLQYGKDISMFIPEGMEIRD